MRRCTDCPTDIDESEDPRRLTCSDRCRTRRSKRLRRADDDRFRDEARGLLMRQTRAIIAGDAEALAAVIADAKRLLG